ncbi:hypothetical protein Aph01nite_78870 [Acrocarpospora phusangensis]|uniref:Uncharacterized protein n=1 Tax=Acrocarpospora phusangensis TaxID=1070424 RepID=A0A919QNX7_9ACTN|nr:hypothetical protein Aph01nite_78870 [Acrocarpospora phusangensis]
MIRMPERYGFRSSQPDGSRRVLIVECPGKGDDAHPHHLGPSQCTQKPPTPVVSSLWRYASGYRKLTELSAQGIPGEAGQGVMDGDLGVWGWAGSPWG